MPAAQLSNGLSMGQVWSSRFGMKRWDALAGLRRERGLQEVIAMKVRVRRTGSQHTSNGVAGGVILCDGHDAAATQVALGTACSP
jgi:hypothetical protein